MICTRHDWWDTAAACPECAAVTATVISSPEPPREPETKPVREKSPDAPIGCLGSLDLPYFLRRAKDGSFLYPELLSCATDTHATSAERTMTPSTNGAGMVRVPTDVISLSDGELSDLASSLDLTLADRQPIYRELHRRVENRKKREGLAALKAKHPGEKWDSKLKEWVPCGTKEQSQPPSSLSVS